MQWNQKSCPALHTSLVVLITPSLNSIFTYEIELMYIRTYQESHLFFFFWSFSIVWVTSFINKPESLRDLIICMTFFNSSFDIVSVVFPEAKLPETLDPNYFYEFLHLMLMLLLILLVSTDSCLTLWARFSSTANWLSLLVQEVYQVILLTVLLWIVEILIISH